MTERLESLVSIVREASSFMTECDFDIKIKHGFADIVTSADINVQRFLADKLSKMIPGCGFNCEEDDLIDPGHEYEWIIDPIDGTTNFARNLRESAICVALAHNGQIELGVVYNPFKQMMFSAEKGMGAFLNGNPIHVSDRIYENSIYFTALCLYRKQYASICTSVLLDVYKDVCDFRRFASCALEMCYMAMGCGELIFELRLLPWDYAAASLILTESGGFCCSLNEAELTFDKPIPILGANTKANLDRLNAVVSKHVPVIPYNDFE